MNDLTDLLKQHLASANVMQLATSVNDQPWVCTVHFYNDEDLNFYWISKPDRRHSLEIKQNQKVAAAVLINENTPTENYIIGISIEGTAELLGKIDEQTARAYETKLAKDPDFITELINGTNPHKFFRLKPSKIVLFDTKNLEGNPRQELIMEEKHD